MAMYQSLLSSRPFLSWVFAVGAILLLSNIIVEAGPAPSAQSEIIDACHKTDYPEVCLEATRPLHFNPEADPASVAKQSIQATIDHCKKARDIAASLSTSKVEDKMAQANLKVCKQVYSDAIDSLHLSMQKLEGAQSHADLLDNLSSTESDLTICDDSFADTPEEVSPLTKTNSYLKKLASNNLALAQNLKLGN